MRFKLNILSLGLLIILSIIITPTVVVEASSYDYFFYSQNELVITPRADIIEWRFKVVDGRLYRRQYNCTRKCWIGEWEVC